MKKKSAFLFSMAAIALIGCTDPSTQTDTDTKGNVFLKFKTTDQGKADSIQVTLIGASTKTFKPDTNGVLTIPELQVGNYKLQIQKNNYAPMICDIVVPVATAEDPSGIANEVSAVFDLEKLGTSISGQASITQMGTTTDLNNANIDAELTPLDANCQFVNARQTATSNSSGTFNFTSLPEFAQIKIIPRSITVSSNTYVSTQTTSFSGLSADSKQVIPTAFNFTLAATDFTLNANNLDTLGQSTPLVFDFSKAIDTTRVRTGDISVTQGANQLAITLTWKNGGKELSISPAIGSTWPNGSMTVNATLFSADDHQTLPAGTFPKTFSVFNSGSLDLVKNLSVTGTSTQLYTAPGVTTLFDTLLIDDGTTALRLKWNKVSNATSYEIYNKIYGVDSAFKLIGTSTDTNFTASGSFDFSMGKRNDVVVVGVNSANRSAFGTPLSLSDTTKPVLNLQNYTLLTIPTTNNTGTSPDTLTAVSKIGYFSEVMDTSKAPVISLSTTAASNAIGFYAHWTGTQSFVIYPYIKAGANTAAIGAFTITVDASSVTDRAKNSTRGTVTLQVTAP